MERLIGEPDDTGSTMSIGPASPEPVVHTIVSGDATDGIRVYAIALAEARRAQSRPTGWFELSDMRWRREPCDIVHVHLADRMLENDRQRWNNLFRYVRSQGLPLVLTLHDVPQLEEGAERFNRRRMVTRTLAAAAVLVVVSSESEQQRCARMGIATSLVPHPLFPVPVGPAPTDAASQVSARTLVVAGFVHPGKGISEFLDRLGDVRGTALDGWQLRLVGDAAFRHRAYVRHVERSARSVGLDFHHTGPVTTGRWRKEMLDASIPIAPHLHCSASGSILSWSAHGRRPVVSGHPFTRELVAQRPDSMTVVGDHDSWVQVLTDSVLAGDRHIVDVAGWRTPSASVDAFDAAIAPLTGAWRRTG